MKYRLGHQMEIMRIVVFNFENFSSNQLENSGCTASQDDTFSSKNNARLKSYWASRYSLSVLMRCIGEDLLLSKDKDLGFPILVNRKGELNNEYFLSISHTEDRAVVALATKPIGVDIENISRNAVTALQRVLSEKEKTTFLNLPNSVQIEGKVVEKSILYWVLKESAAKATGLGMTKGFDIFELEAASNGSFKVSTPKEAPFTLITPTCQPFIVDNFLLSVCTEAALLGGGIRGSVFRLLDLNGKLEQLD